MLIATTKLITTIKMLMTTKKAILITIKTIMKTITIRPTQITNKRIILMILNRLYPTCHIQKAIL